MLRWLPTSSLYPNPEDAWPGNEHGMTLIELMISIVLIGVLSMGVMACLQIGSMANARVEGQAVYSQELVLMANQLLDGSGSQFRGLREANGVTQQAVSGFNKYVLTYAGDEASHTEAYWVEDNTLRRGVGGEGNVSSAPMGAVSSLAIDGPDADGICTLTLVAQGHAGRNETYRVKVRLRNYSKTS